ncbi:hypothetical protein GUJ93_ZPchr0013g34534 [Zizania palustris]|uniref:Uncharacterized protein n=1 Tax=Zizania palustris TaxID=103762 RepID=A0A8J5X2A3_ZIZPA|nr:hypothetical protein GUJ93_ZPchr0013g34534 [Zizania palustris]
MFPTAKNYESTLKPFLPTCYFELLPALWQGLIREEYSWRSTTMLAYGSTEASISYKTTSCETVKVNCWMLDAGCWMHRI